MAMWFALNELVAPRPALLFNAATDNASEVIMNARPAALVIFILGSLAGSFAAAATVTPSSGQGPEQVQKDTTECQAAADSAAQATADATAPEPVSKGGGRVKGAAKGAAVGATAAHVQANDSEIYEHASDDAKREYRQNEAEGAAAAGAMVGASKKTPGATRRVGSGGGFATGERRRSCIDVHELYDRARLPGCALTARR